MLLNIGPFADPIEMIGIGGVTTQHTVLDLGAGAVERIVVTVIELVEQLDELVTAAGLYPKIVNMKVVALGRQWYQCHHSLLLSVSDGLANRQTRAGDSGNWLGSAPSEDSALPT